MNGQILQDIKEMWTMKLDMNGCDQLNKYLVVIFFQSKQTNCNTFGQFQLNGKLPYKFLDL